MKQSNERKDENHKKDSGSIKQRSHPILAELEARHTNAEVEKGLNFTSGQRIRLSYSPVREVIHPTTRKMGSDNAGDPKKAKSTHPGLVDCTSISVASPISESDYSDPEVDSIIRALPLDNDQFGEPSALMPQSEVHSFAGSIKRKAPLFLDEPAARKRARRDGAISHSQSDLHNDVPLHTYPIPNAMRTPPRRAREESPESDDVEIVETHFAQQNTAVPIQSVSVAVQQDANNNNEFAELDAWLNSGAVDIVYD